jgi:hypothetical protein
MNIIVCDICGKEIKPPNKFASESNRMGFIDYKKRYGFAICYPCEPKLSELHALIDTENFKKFQKITFEIDWLHNIIMQIDWTDKNLIPIFGSMVDKFQEYKERFMIDGTKV